MSKYYVNKFLFTVDRNPDYLKRYTEDPAISSPRGNSRSGRGYRQEVELSTVHRLHGESARRWSTHDYVALFEMGAHFFST